ncbi:MAG: hypothetical protein J0L92_01155 [Deltaproteobacteria bacterium]|nr:hypothetical protein [Deltaproteobacteria bacterium]
MAGDEKMGTEADTCLFTGERLGVHTAVEHAIPRDLGGRIRSKRITSSRFNNATSRNFDELLTAPYKTAFNYLAPLLAAEHQQAPLDIEVGGSEQLLLYPGGEVGLRGHRVTGRGSDGRPTSIIGEDVSALAHLAARAGRPGDRWSYSDEVAACEPDLVRKRVPVLAPAMEVAALKCALLAFDAVLADHPTARFTRSGWLAPVRDAIRDIVLHDADAGPLLERVCWGLAPGEADGILQLRRELVKEPEGPFEHVLIASGDPRSGSLDLAWLLAGIDVWTFRLTRLWHGPPFTALAGCGALRDTRCWEPAVVDARRWQLRGRTAERSTQSEATSLELERIADEIEENRRRGYRRAVDLVERRSDEVVMRGILHLARFPESKPILYPSSTLVEHGLERRLRRMFASQCAAADAVEFLSKCIAAEVGALSPDIRAQQVARDDDVGVGVAWDAWIACHRRILDVVAPRFGLPGCVYTISTTIELAE